MVNMKTLKDTNNKIGHNKDTVRHNDTATMHCDATMWQ